MVKFVPEVLEATTDAEGVYITVYFYLGTKPDLSCCVLNFSKEKKYGINWYINQFIKWAKVSGLFVNIVRKLFTVHILYQVRSGLDLKYVILEFSLHNLDQWNSRDRAVFHQNSDEIFPYFIFPVWTDINFSPMVWLPWSVLTLFLLYLRDKSWFYCGFLCVT